MQLTVVVENQTSSQSLLAEWGYSAWLQTEDVVVLLDTGGIQHTLQHNLTALGLEAKRITDLVLSHGHFDHTSGVMDVLRMAPDVRVWAAPGIGRERLGDADAKRASAPLRITGRPLHAAHYQSPVASAQVKSCVLLAGMYADGITSVTEPVLSRNHTEIMLNYFGANVTSQGTTASIEPEPVLNGREIKVPGDISSAAYFIAAGLLTPGSEILLKNVGINPTRDGMLRVCKAMGADITLLNASTEGEPTADLLIRTSSLHGTTVEGEIIPTLIDEIPMIAVMAAFAEGTTVIRDAQELKVKESDRIAVVTEGLKRMGADIQPTDDGMIIHGGKPPFEAAKRELGEECGLTADHYTPLGEFYPTVGYDTEIIYMWVATGLHTTQMHLDDDEFLTPDRIPLAKAYEMVMSGEIKDGKTIAGVLKLKALVDEGRL